MQEQIDQEFETIASKLLTDASDAKPEAKKPFIFYGSTHCNLSRYNIGVVSPGFPYDHDHLLISERGDPFSGEPQMQNSERRSGPIVHRKKFPARRAGEKARVPDDHFFRLYPFKAGQIAVLICSDAVDLNQFWNIVRHNQQSDISKAFHRINLVIVPSYTQSDLLHEVCRDLSDAARTNVMLSNACGKYKTNNLHRPKSMPSSEFYFMGMDQTELCANGLISSQHRDGIRYYTVHAQKQREFRRQHPR